MYSILKSFLICLLLLLINVENFKLTKNDIRSHLKKQRSLLNAPVPTARQSHMCYADCSFTLFFNDSLILPNDCNQIETNYACEMIVILDYGSRDMLLYFYSNAESLNIHNISYDSATLHFAYMEFNDSIITHVFDYTCATGNYCEWENIQHIVPKLILLDYQPLYNALLPKVFNSNGLPSLIQCYKDTELTNCSSGTCEYYQSADDNYQLEITRDCSIFDVSSVEVGKAQYFPGPARHDYDVIGFTCDTNNCNGQSNEYEIRQIVSANSNEYININSSGIKVQWTNFNLYVLLFILIIFFK